MEDLRLAARIEYALRASGYCVLRDIEVFVKARDVHLVGRVPSYYLKQIAQVTALAIPGTHQIHKGPGSDPAKLTPRRSFANATLGRGRVQEVRRASHRRLGCQGTGLLEGGF